MLMRAYSSAVPIGQPFFSLLQDRCFFGKGARINESGLAQGHANSRKAFNYTEMWYLGIIYPWPYDLALLFCLCFVLLLVRLRRYKAQLVCQVLP